MTQSGEVVSHQAHNLGTGGANPSSATKHGVFMIKISFTLTLTPNSPRQDVFSFEDVLREHYTDFHDFFKNQLQQSLILNYFEVDEINSDTMTSSYFSTTTENAQAFVDAAFDASANFSPVIIWNQNGFNLTSELHEVNFDTINAEPLFDSNDRAWNLPV